MARQRGLITHQQCLACGMDPRAVRQLLSSGAWVRVRRGVYADADAWGALDEFHGRPLQRVRAASLVLERSHHFSHDSAALALGIWLPDARASLVHVTRPRVLGRRIEAGIKHHKATFTPAQSLVVDGLPVLGLARTALDIAREHGLTPGVAAVDSARRLGASLAELREVAEQMWCWPGSRVIAGAITLSDPRSESYGEAAARVLVHELGIGWPEAQFELSDGVRHVACDLRVGRHVFEFDGKLKYLTPEQGGIDVAPAGQTLWQEKKRQDFVTGFKLGMSRITTYDLHAGRAAARGRLIREFEDTCRRFGTSIDDLAPYIVHRRYPPAASG